jgi:hypothetical protein
MILPFIFLCVEVIPPVHVVKLWWEGLATTLVVTNNTAAPSSTITAAASGGTSIISTTTTTTILRRSLVPQSWWRGRCRVRLIVPEVRVWPLVSRWPGPNKPCPSAHVSWGHKAVVPLHHEPLSGEPLGSAGALCALVVAVAAAEVFALVHVAVVVHVFVIERTPSLVGVDHVDVSAGGAVRSPAARRVLVAVVVEAVAQAVLALGAESNSGTDGLQVGMRIQIRNIRHHH